MDGLCKSRSFRAVLLLLCLLVLTFASACSEDPDPYAPLSRDRTPQASSEEMSEESSDPEAERYAAAAELEAAGNYEDAARVFASLGDYSDAEERAEICRSKDREETLEAAKALLNAREYGEAKELFRTLEEYLDVQQYIEECETGESRERFWAMLLELEPGSRFVFGTYGTDELEWILLEKGEESMLVLSSAVLTELPMAAEMPEAFSWTASEPYRWLTEEFYGSAFSEEEKRMIRYGEASDGAGEEGLLFLLTEEEAEAYAEEAALPDAEWWLYPQASEPAEETAPVVSAGEEFSVGRKTLTEMSGVRPAFRIGH